MNYTKPRHRVLGTIGDMIMVVVMPFDGESYNQIEYVEPPPDDSDEDEYMLYRVEIPKNVFEEFGYWIRDNKRDEFGRYHKADTINSMCSALGIEPADFLDRCKSRKIMDRAIAIWEISMCFGWHELDHYPVKMTRKEIESRWVRWGSKRK